MNEESQDPLIRSISWETLKKLGDAFGLLGKDRSSAFVATLIQANRKGLLNQIDGVDGMTALLEFGDKMMRRRNSAIGLLGALEASVGDKSTLFQRILASGAFGEGNKPVCFADVKGHVTSASNPMSEEELQALIQVLRTEIGS